MNLDELTDELHGRADAGAPASGPGGQVARLTGVRHRIQVRRRRRAGVAVVAVAVLAAGIVWNPALPGFKADRTTPATVSAALDARFPARYGDDPRIAAAIGDPGQTVLELRFTPDSGNLQVASFCSSGIDADQGRGKAKLPVKVTVNGSHGFMQSSCSDGATGDGGRSSFDEDDPRKNAAIWKSRFGVVPGEESVIRIAYTGVTDPKVKLGIGIYVLSGPRVKVGTKAVQQTITFGERRYRLQRSAFVPLGPGFSAARRTVTLPGTAVTGDVVCYGATRALETDPGSTDLLYQDGLQSGGSSSGGYACSSVESKAPATFTMKAGKAARGDALITLYRKLG